MYFCSLECKQSYYKEHNKIGCCDEQTKRGRDKRLQLILEKGGKCELCGYNKNYAALTFHHREIGSKNFNLSQGFCRMHSIERLRKEANKCILLCSNCHMELHHPELNILKTK